MTAPRVKVNKALRDAAKRNAEKVSGSNVFCVLFNEKMIDEVVPLIQMGLAVYLDKPIVVLAPKGATIPINVRRMATKIEEFDPDSKDDFNAAVARLMATE